MPPHHRRPGQCYPTPLHPRHTHLATPAFLPCDCICAGDATGGVTRLSERPFSEKLEALYKSRSYQLAVAVAETEQVRLPQHSFYLQMLLMILEVLYKSRSYQLAVAVAETEQLHLLSTSLASYRQQLHAFARLASSPYLVVTPALWSQLGAPLVGIYERKGVSICTSLGAPIHSPAFCLPAHLSASQPNLFHSQVDGALLLAGYSERKSFIDLHPL